MIAVFWCLSLITPLQLSGISVVAELWSVATGNTVLAIHGVYWNIWSKHQPESPLLSNWNANLTLVKIYNQGDKFCAYIK